MELDLRWKRAGSREEGKDRGRLLSLFGYMPPRTRMSLLRCPEKRRRRTEGWGKSQKVDREKMGKAGTSGTVSHCLTMVSCPFFDARKDQRKREREKEKERKTGVSNSSDRGTPQRTLSTHGNIPVSSPLNIKHKHNVPYNTSLFCKATSPSVGICGYNNRDNYTPNYLHFALSDNNYKACYQQKADKGDTEHRNY